MKPLIIGIAGGTGSGKTTLVERLREQFGQDISVLNPTTTATTPPTTTCPWRSGRPSTTTTPPPSTPTR